jgi:3-oxoacyl-[acyl-carrier protein] reductase
MTDDDWRQAFEVVTLNFVRFVREVTPFMREQQWGRIIGMQSSSVKEPVPNIDLSNGIRPGIAGLMKAMVPDLAKDGITINLVLPGIFLTDRLRHRMAAGPAGADDATIQQHIASTIPIGRIGRPGGVRTPGGVSRVRAGRLHHRRRLPDRRRHHPVERVGRRPSVSA